MLDLFVLNQMPSMFWCTS